MNTNARKCPECGSGSVYTTTTGSAGGQGPALLPQLGTFWRSAMFQVVVCRECGLTRFYAEEKAREKLPKADRWTLVQ